MIAVDQSSQLLPSAAAQCNRRRSAPPTGAERRRSVATSTDHRLRPPKREGRLSLAAPALRARPSPRAKHRPASREKAPQPTLANAPYGESSPSLTGRRLLWSRLPQPNRPARLSERGSPRLTDWRTKPPGSGRSRRSPPFGRSRRHHHRPRCHCRCFRFRRARCRFRPRCHRRFLRS